MSLDDLLKKVEKNFSFRKDCKVNGTKFTLGLLDFDESIKLSELSEGEDGEGGESKDPLGYYNKVMRRTLSYAIKAVDDEEIPEIVETEVNGKKANISRPVYLRNFLDRMPSTVISNIFEVYIDFKAEIDNKLKDNLEYDWFEEPKEEGGDGKEDSDKKGSKDSNEEDKEEVAEHDKKEVNLKVIKEDIESPSIPDGSE